MAKKEKKSVSRARKVLRFLNPQTESAVTARNAALQDSLEPDVYDSDRKKKKR